MKRSLTAFFIAILFLVSLQFICSEIRINEIMPHTNNSYGDEWVELYNTENVDLEIVNWTIADASSSDKFSLEIPANGFALIIDSSMNCSSFNIPITSCFALTTIGSGLNDATENVSLYNNQTSLISNFSWAYSITSTGKSWSYNGSWQICVPTPGRINNCTSIQNSTNTTIPTNSTNSTSSNNSTNSSSSNNSSLATSLELEWTSSSIINNKDFEITIKAFNLGSYDYDLKLWLEFQDNDTIISERYDSKNDEWKSGTYYLEKFFSGPGNKTREADIRLKSDYKNISGNVKILGRLRRYDTSSSITDIANTLKIIKSSDSSSSSNQESSTISLTAQTSVNPQNETGVIRLSKNPNSINLGSNLDSNKQNSIIYKSKNEYIKDYAPYVFCLLCIFVIILLLTKKIL